MKVGEDSHIYCRSFVTETEYHHPELYNQRDIILNVNFTSYWQIGIGGQTISSHLSFLKCKIKMTIKITSESCEN